MLRSLAPLAAAVVASLPTASAQCAFEEELKILSGDGAPGDVYGGPLCADGDVLAVGAPLEDGVAINTGAVYVHRRLGDGWVLEQKLTSSDPKPFDDFGISVVVEGDVLVVGALFGDVTVAEQGEAFVFRYNGVSWQEEQRLTASDPATGDRFGRSVDIQGDWIAVGAYRNDDLGDNVGSVYLYQHNGVEWVERQELFASDAAPGDLFGIEVAFSGDALLVGSYFDDTTAVDTGSGYVFRFDGVTWTEEQKLVSSDAAAGDFLGGVVALDGNTAVLGAYGDDAAGADSGAAYVFEFDGTTWVEVQELVASDGSANDEFGWAVSVQGDRIAVGAYEDDALGHKAGSAYLYRRSGGGWVEERKLVASDAAMYDTFGSDVYLNGDELWVGSPMDDDAGGESGSAYLFDVRELGLDVDPAAVATGQTLAVTVAPGAPGNLSALFVVELGGNPTLSWVATLPFGNDCRASLSAVIPPGLVGLVAKVQAFGYPMTGGIEATNVVEITFL